MSTRLVCDVDGCEQVHDVASTARGYRLPEGWGELLKVPAAAEVQARAVSQYRYQRRPMPRLFLLCPMHVGDLVGRMKASSRAAADLSARDDEQEDGA